MGRAAPEPPTSRSVRASGSWPGPPPGGSGRAPCTAPSTPPAGSRHRQLGAGAALASRQGAWGGMGAGRAGALTGVQQLPLGQGPPVPVGELLRLVQGLAQHLLHQEAEAPRPLSLAHARGRHIGLPNLQKQCPGEAAPGRMARAMPSLPGAQWSVQGRRDEGGRSWLYRGLGLGSLPRAPERSPEQGWLWGNRDTLGGPADWTLVTVVRGRAGVGGPERTDQACGPARPARSPARAPAAGPGPPAAAQARGPGRGRRPPVSSGRLPSHSL